MLFRSEDVKNLPPIETLCEPTTHPPMVEVHSLYEFDAGDIPYNKSPDQCLDEFDAFIVKQTHFNEQVQSQLNENSLSIKNLHATLGRTVNDVKGLVKHFEMIQTQLEQLTRVQNDLFAELSVKLKNMRVVLKLEVVLSLMTLYIPRDTQKGLNKTLK